MSHGRSYRRGIQRRRATVTAATTATALAAGLSVGAPVAHGGSPSTCSVTANDLGGGVYEIRFTDTGTCDWTVPDGVSQLEALLVGSGGGSVAAYAGGGGEVTLVDLTGTTGRVTVTVGATSTPPARTGVDSEVIAGASTYTAAGGWGGATDGSGECGGKSGNNNLGHCDYSGNDGGGGSSGAANADGDGGAGTVVDAIAGATSLFDGVTDCYGGGGAAARGTFSTYPTLTAFDPKTPGCGGGKVTTTATFPVDVGVAVYSHDISANTGGGAGAWGVGNNGSNGLVVVRYRTADDSPPPDEGLSTSGTNSSLYATFGAVLLAAGVIVTSAARRRRHA